jgi:hypothetical protein
MALLDELSTLSGQARAALVSELVDAALPALKVTLDALRLVKAQPAEAQRLLSEFASHQTAALAQAQLDFGRAVDGRTVKGRRQKGRSGGRP